MTTSKRRTLLALIGVLSFYSCGLDGGSRGTGITSVVEGNVAAVEMAASLAPRRNRNFAQLPQTGHFVRSLQPTKTAVVVEGITVAVEPGWQHSATDSAGGFWVNGSFEGPVTLWFNRPQDAILASTAIDIPAGGTLTLHDVLIDNTRGVATAKSEDVDFLGQIVRVDCASQKLVLVPSQHAPSDTDTYTLRLDTSSLINSQGKPISCTELRTGQIAHVQGTVNADGTFGHAQVVVE